MLWVVALLGEEGAEEEAEVRLVAPVDGSGSRSNGPHGSRPMRPSFVTLLSILPEALTHAAS